MTRKINAGFDLRKKSRISGAAGKVEAEKRKGLVSFQHKVTKGSPRGGVTCNNRLLSELPAFCAEHPSFLVTDNLPQPGKLHGVPKSLRHTLLFHFSHIPLFDYIYTSRAYFTSILESERD